MPKTDSAVVAVFDGTSQAQAAATDLTANAFAGDHIHLATSSDVKPSDRTTIGPAVRYHDGDVKEWLECVRGEDSETERQQYEDAVHTGKSLVGLNTPRQMAGRAAEILNRHSPVTLQVDEETGTVPTAPSSGSHS